MLDQSKKLLSQLGSQILQIYERVKEIDSIEYKNLLLIDEKTFIKGSISCSWVPVTISLKVEYIIKL